jgi:hypothetical protein
MMEVGVDLDLRYESRSGASRWLEILDRKAMLGDYLLACGRGTQAGARESVSRHVQLLLSLWLAAWNDTIRHFVLPVGCGLPKEAVYH